MQRLPQDELREALSLISRDGEIDKQTAIHLKKKLAEEFREQLSVGIPTNEDEAGLRKLAEQITSKKVLVKLFLRHPLYAKLYLLFRLRKLKRVASLDRIVKPEWRRPRRTGERVQGLWLAFTGESVVVRKCSRSGHEFALGAATPPRGAFVKTPTRSLTGKIVDDRGIESLRVMALPE